MKKNNTWDELDFLFNRAKLKNIDIGEAFHDRAAILADIVSIITKNNLEYFLDEPTNNPSINLPRVPEFLASMIILSLYLKPLIPFP